MRYTHFFNILECGEGPLRYKVVQSTENPNGLHPVSSVFILGEQDGPLVNSTHWASGKHNTWLLPAQTTGQGFTVRIDYCARMIAGVRIKNARNQWKWATDEFKVSASLDETGPWETMVDSHLPDTTEGQAAELLNFTFEQPVKLKYLKFEFISYWGVGGGLQYFAAIPGKKHQSVIKCLSESQGGSSAETTTESAITNTILTESYVITND